MLPTSHHVSTYEKDRGCWWFNYNNIFDTPVLITVDYRVAHRPRVLYLPYLNPKEKFQLQDPLAVFVVSNLRNLDLDLLSLILPTASRCGIVGRRLEATGLTVESQRGSKSCPIGRHLTQLFHFIRVHIKYHPLASKFLALSSATPCDMNAAYRLNFFVG